MNWTVSRRIVAGFALGLVLVAAVTIIGIWSLNRTESGYRNASGEERSLLRDALEARGSVRSANIYVLRYIVDRDVAHAQAMDSALSDARVRVQRVTRQASGLDAERSWQEALAQLGDYTRTLQQITGLIRGGEVDRALELRAAVAQPQRVLLENAVNEGVAAAQAETDRGFERAEGVARAAQVALWIALALALLIGTIAGYLLNRAISGPLEETSNVLATSAAQIVATTTQQASGATESLAAVTETAATVDEVVQTAEQAAERARGVASTAQHAADIGRQGRDAVDQSVATMNRVREHVDSIGKSILSLADRAQAIGEIISTVTELAEQTNLLALNAAIEAARAGEQGRGFAVVAGEIKSLAEQSREATARVSEILGQIQRATSQAVMTTEEGTRRVVEGVQQVTEAGSTIRTLADAVLNAAQAAAQIAASANQQSAGMGQVRQAISNIQQAAQQNLAATRQAENAAQELNRLGSRLLELVGTENSGRNAA